MDRLGSIIWRGAWAGAILAPAAFLTVFFLHPVTDMLATGLEGASISEVLGTAPKPRTLKVLLNTLTQAGMGTALSVLLGVPGAYVLYRLSFPGQRALRALATVGFVLPTVVVGVAFRALLGRGGPLEFLGLDETITSVVLALAFFNYSVVVRQVGTMWASLDPDTARAARTLGASRWRAFRTVTLPHLAPAITSSAAIVFLFCSTSYGLVRTLGSPGYGTLETEIWRQAKAYLDIQSVAVLSIIQILVILLVLGISAAVTSDPLTLRRYRAAPTVSDIPALAVTAVAMVFLALPLLTLALRSLKSRSGWGLENYRLLATAGEGFAGGAPVTEAIGNSLRTASVAALIALAAGTLIALVLSRRTSGPLRVGQALYGGLILAPIGVSAVTVGYGFSVALDSPPLDLRSSPWLIPIAQAVVALPLVVRSLTPLLSSINPAQREAAATLGASPWRVLATVDGPYLWRGMGVAAGFAFAASLGEFGATSFLARPDTQTLPVVIVRLLGRPGENNYGMAMAAAVILGVVTATIMAVAELRRKDTHD